VDFWGAGFDVAKQMGIVPELMEKGYRPNELREIAADGRVIVSLDPRRMIDDAAGGVAGRYVTVARTDLASAIYSASQGRIETIFGDTVNLIHDDGSQVQVEFSSGGRSEFDLVAVMNTEVGFQALRFAQRDGAIVVARAGCLDRRRGLVSIPSRRTGGGPCDGRRVRTRGGVAPLCRSLVDATPFPVLSRCQSEC
jgi:hypothetical protein